MTLTALCLAWVLSMSGVSVNLEHVAAIKIKENYSQVLGQNYYQVVALPDEYRNPSYVLAQFYTKQEAIDYVAQLPQ